MACSCRSKKALYITAAVGVLCILAGGALLWGFAIFTKNTVISDTTLVPGTTAYDTWKQPPVPLIMQYWVWDIQNPAEFLNGEVPIVEQKGPYTYFEHRIKTNITHNHENGTVSFRNSKMYVFDLEQSVGPDTDKFTTANLPVFTIANLLKDSPGPVKNIQKMIHAISGAESVLELSVADILWGYEDDYLMLFDQLFPGLLPTTFGLFQGSNNSDDGVWEEYTGESGYENTGTVISWDGYYELPWWVTDYANMLNGSDGTVTPPFVEKGDEIYFYVPDICRSGFLTYEYSYQLMGITVGRFSAPAYLYADADEWPDNAGFCTPDGTHCPPTGLLNATECQSGAPVYYSSPHFLYGTDSLFEGVIGMNPNKEEHKVYFDIQMLTGIIMEVANRLQVNLKVDPYEWVDDTILIKPTYLPILWLNESSSIDQASADFFIGTIQLPLLIARIIIIILLAVGAGLVIGVITTCLCWRCKDKPKMIDDTQELTRAEGKSQDRELKDVAS